MAHLLFLSHAGADTERAVKLAAAIEASPEAQAAGLKVWVDKRPDGAAPAARRHALAGPARGGDRQPTPPRSACC